MHLLNQVHLSETVNQQASMWCVEMTQRFLLPHLSNGIARIFQLFKNIVMCCCRGGAVAWRQDNLIGFCLYIECIHGNADDDAKGHINIVHFLNYSKRNIDHTHKLFCISFKLKYNIHMRCKQIIFDCMQKEKVRTKVRQQKPCIETAIGQNCIAFTICVYVCESVPL